jgi:hypothetical protein
MYQDLQSIREMEAEAKQSADKAVRTFEQIRAERIRIEAQHREHQDKDDEHRGTVIRGPWIAAGVSLVGAGARWLHGNTRAAAVFAAGAAVTTAAAVAVTPPGHDPAPPDVHAGALPALAPTPTRHHTPPAGPPRTRPFRRPDTIPQRKQPALIRPRPSASPAPTPLHLPPKLDLPIGHPLKAKRPRSGQPDATPACRIYMTRLINRGLICGRLGQ